MTDGTDESSEHSDKYADLVHDARQEAEAAHRRQEQTVGSLPYTPDPLERLRDQGQIPLPDSLPGYELMREIHRGGQGVVYQAIQKATKRKVAVKVIREGPFAGRHDKVRFEREVQILAQLKHPGLVGVFDSGEVSGCVYFVMDYISGRPLDAHLAGTCPSMPEVLKLFARICDAVHQAHLRGVIHRDLKPGNVLIDAEGEPHVVDFGLARAAGGQYTEEGVQAMTITGQFVGTLPYASPEQAEGLPDKIDIRTDVYSLGVMLYQALTGRFPYLTDGSISDVFQNILHAKPRPARQFRPEVDDDVETIVGKCLCKERERRYQSAGELARDIRHYLADEPIEARRDSALYVLQKMLLRYKLAAGVTAAFLMLVVASIISLSILYGQAVAARNRAEHEADKARQMSEFLQRMVAAAAPGMDGKTVLVTTVLEKGRENIQAPIYSRNPETTAWMQNILGNCYLGLGLLDEAEQHLKQALQERHRILGDQHPDTLAAMHDMARLLQELGKVSDVETLMRETLAARRKVLTFGHMDTVESMSDLANSVARQNRWSEALDLYRDAACLCSDSRPQYAALLRFRLGMCLSHMGRREEAEREMLAAYDELCATYGRKHDYTRSAGEELYEFYRSRGEPEKARKFVDAVSTRPASRDSAISVLSGFR